MTPAIAKSCIASLTATTLDEAEVLAAFFSSDMYQAAGTFAVSCCWLPRVYTNTLYTLFEPCASFINT